jgi:elongator complex protein 4
MSFRKRNVVVGQRGDFGVDGKTQEQVSVRGVRPSPIDGRLTTSTGTRSLDSLLAGHAGLVLGTSFLIEESGTTDFGGTLLRYYASEGVAQGHLIHVLGISEAWGRELPGLSSEGSSARSEQRHSSDEKMKIAWRYERLGEFGSGARGEYPMMHLHLSKYGSVFVMLIYEQTDLNEQRHHHKAKSFSVMILISASGSLSQIPCR